jgi:MSHA biogenesis protein MshP
MKRRQTGLGIIAAIMVLVILGGLSAAIVSLSTGQQMSSAQDVLSSQAWQVASAGVEGSLYKAMKAATCGTETWTSADYPPFRVTAICTSSNYNDGETSPGVARVLRVFRIEATACNGGAASCPDNGASAGIGYVERQRIAVAYCEWSGVTCVGP